MLHSLSGSINKLPHHFPLPHPAYIINVVTILRYLKPANLLEGYLRLPSDPRPEHSIEGKPWTGHRRRKKDSPNTVEMRSTSSTSTRYTIMSSYAYSPILETYEIEILASSRQWTVQSTWHPAKYNQFTVHRIAQTKQRDSLVRNKYKKALRKIHRAV